MNTETNGIDAVFLDVVERLAFMFGDSCEPEEIDGYEGTWVSASVAYRAAGSGVLSLVVPTTMCAEIAANILGLEPEDIAGVAIAEDALKEMLNVVAGHVVPALGAQDDDFELEVPRILRLDAEQCRTLARSAGTVCFDLDGTPVMLVLAPVGGAE